MHREAVLCSGVVWCGVGCGMRRRQHRCHHLAFVPADFDSADSKTHLVGGNSKVQNRTRANSTSRLRHCFRFHGRAYLNRIQSTQSNTTRNPFPHPKTVTYTHRQAAVAAPCPARARKGPDLPLDLVLGHDDHLPASPTIVVERAGSCGNTSHSPAALRTVPTVAWLRRLRWLTMLLVRAAPPSVLGGGWRD